LLLHHPEKIKMAAITIEELTARVAEQESATFVSITTETVPKMNKTKLNKSVINPYYGRVTRQTVRSGMFAASYESCVNRQRMREAGENEVVEHFNAGQLWQGKGEHVSPAVVRHTVSGELYFAFYPTRTTAEGHPIANQDVWTLDGEPVVDADVLADIKSFLPAPSKSQTQETEKQVPWRVFKLESLKAVRMHKETLEVAA
jgi:hypothetical protein